MLINFLSAGQKRHWRQAHAAEQDLSCPGCQKKFTRVGGLMVSQLCGSVVDLAPSDLILSQSHIELTECPAMKAQYLARRNEKDSMTGQFDLIREAMAWGTANDGITFGTSVDNVASLEPAVLSTPNAVGYLSTSPIQFTDAPRHLSPFKKLASQQF